MKKLALVGVLCVVVSAFAICWPKPVFAQRGGHAGGGGFHGGGGVHSGGGFHGSGGYYAYGGSRFYGSYHAGGYYGWHGGHHGWYGPHWGYPYYGYGWGFSIGIGFGWPYSLSYGYPYGYGLWWGAPYYYPYYAPAYPYPNNGSNDPRPPNSGLKSNNDSQHNNSGVPAGRSAHSLTTTRTASSAVASYSRVVHSAMEELQPPRREVQNAIRALREMPPFVRQREIDHGRYSNFSPEEKELLRRIEDGRRAGT
jgi:hypothetical protein